MAIIKAYPPNYKEIKKVFKDLPDSAIFTYGSVIYAPNNDLNPILMRHEEIHSQQQKEMGVEKWWDRYLRDANFRLSQEVEAFQQEYRLAKKLIKDRNSLARLLFSMAKNLSAPMYGKIISYQQAFEAIKCEKLYKFKV